MIRTNSRTKAERAPETEAQRVVAFNKKFYAAHKPQMQAWFDQTGNQDFPIVKNPDGTHHWMNRQERKRVAAIERRTGKPMLETDRSGK